jgi:hypothetical protein
VRSRDGVTFADEAGLAAVDPRRERAYVFAADAPVGEVDLATMRVTYHRLEALSLDAGELADIEVRPEDLGSRTGAPSGSGTDTWSSTGAISCLWAVTRVRSRQERRCWTLPGGLPARSIAGQAERRSSSAGFSRTAAETERTEASGGTPCGAGQPSASSAASVFGTYGRPGAAAMCAAARSMSVVRGTRSTVYVIDATSGKVLRELVPRGELVDVVSSRL